MIILQGFCLYLICFFILNYFWNYFSKYNAFDSIFFNYFFKFNRAFLFFDHFQNLLRFSFQLYSKFIFMITSFLKINLRNFMIISFQQINLMIFMIISFWKINLININFLNRNINLSIKFRTQIMIFLIYFQVMDGKIYLYLTFVK